MDWKEKLTPFDAELCVMVESLTGKPCEAKNGGEHYFIEVDYSEHKGDADYINAIMNAVEGRLGERLITIEDQPERSAFIAKIKFSDSKLPRLVSIKMTTPNLSAGNQFCKRPAIVRAREVSRHTANLLCQFVGGGEMEIPEQGPCVFHFINNGGVWAHAPEGSFIVHVKDAQFQIIDRKTFYENYELR